MKLYKTLRYRIKAAKAIPLAGEYSHINWLCECHPWLRPYFPDWDIFIPF